ncbi:type IX secretion system membrane protein PorP/SprF [Aquimarina sp. 2201CG5-10]|uniref:PorP/SprF family type IX secretion system membrane protein n=1 Tax=Aquimarina callyspongiae TaxID=3098150 RepID=UPI002AB42AFE|nr:type IX secretion system membrane protein PorP/SprF [Aquimarina sp. 2201CG5-10]MDY8136902.1 type IX secretion system membrane protein PorP/SprF [Aquimarina sp. 2201CG5-10]
MIQLLFLKPCPSILSFKSIFMVLFTVICIYNTKTYSQQDAQYTQYMYNTISINPAYAGSRKTTSITGLYRNQWVGIEGAPDTQTINIHSPIGEKQKVGLGLSIINDKIGPSQETYFNVDFSYTLKASEKGKLSLGIKAGGHLLDVDFNRLNQYSTSDILLDTNIDNKFSPNVGIGFYYYTQNFYLGLSAPNLLETKHFNESSNDNTASSFLAAERVNYYLILGQVFDLNHHLKFKPAILGKAVSGAPVQVDVSANFLMYDKLTLGLAYRWDSALSAQAGFQISKSMLLGFAYDWETTALGNTEFNSGTYEFFLRFDIFKKEASIFYPRFF